MQVIECSWFGLPNGWADGWCRRCVLQVVQHRADVERSRHPEGPGERSAPLGEVDAHRVGVHVGSPPRQASGGISGEDTTDHDDTQQG